MKLLSQSYKHGAYGYLGASILTNPSISDNIPVYFGTAPLHLATGTPAAVNQPILIQSYDEAVRILGYTTNWEDFTLCEAIDAHFLNEIQPVGPIVVVNVFDPTTMIASEAASASVPLRNGSGRFTDPLCIASSITIPDKELGTDYIVSYDPSTGQHTLRDLTGAMASPIAITYKRVDPSGVSAVEIIGEVSDEDSYSGLFVAEQVYPVLGIIPSMLVAPGWSHDIAVHAAMVKTANLIGGHWYAWLNTDIPAGDVNTTIQQAADWQAANGYMNESETPCWPKVRKGDKIYHLSTITTVAMMQTDLANGGLPYATPSNNLIDISGYYINEKKIPQYARSQLNSLNSVGIRTVSRWGGRWVLWGFHTGAIGSDEPMDARAYSDAGMRMLYYVLNRYQAVYGEKVDQPMTRGTMESILLSIQDWLDGLVSTGALLLGEVSFNENENSTDDLVKGKVKFNIQPTTVPPLQVLTAEVSYTDRGLSVLFGEEAAE